MERISTGSKLLDSLLEGGYDVDAITTVYGPPGVGKTTLALISSLAQAKKGKSVIYVDTEGGFSISRLAQLAGKKAGKLIKKFAFLRPTTFSEQAKAIERLPSIVNPKVGLVVVDTIGMLFRLERLPESREFARELGIQMRDLNLITRRKKVPVLLTNQVYSVPETGEVRMVGGDIVNYASKCLLELKILNSGWRKIILRKHRSVPGEREASFRITNEGIEGDLVS